MVCTQYVQIRNFGVVLAVRSRLCYAVRVFLILVLGRKSKLFVCMFNLFVVSVAFGCSFCCFSFVVLLRFELYVGTSSDLFSHHLWSCRLWCYFWWVVAFPADVVLEFWLTASGLRLVIQVSYGAHVDVYAYMYICIYTRNGFMVALPYVRRGVNILCIRFLILHGLYVIIDTWCVSDGISIVSFALSLSFV